MPRGGLPGGRLGMRDGVILVGGRRRRRRGLAMRRGLIAVGGECGGRARPGDDRGLAASPSGPVGRLAGVGMKRGTIAALGADPDSRSCRRSRRAGGPAPVPDDLPQTAGGVGLPRPRRGVRRPSGCVTMATSRTGARGRSWSGPDSQRRLRPSMDLNARALRLVEVLLERAEDGRSSRTRSRRGAGSSTAGSRRAAACAPGSSWRGSAWPTSPTSRSSPATSAGRACPLVQVATDHPVAACLASQYAGWAIQEGKFFAMGSGPMRAAAGKEADLSTTIGHRESPTRSSACSKAAEAADARGRRHDRVGLPASRRRRVTAARRADGQPGGGRAGRGAVGRDGLAQAPRARLRRQPGRLGHRHRPLPPVASDDLAAIGRTNDAILYGARVVLYVDGRRRLASRTSGRKVPSSASKDHGEPFASIFARYNHDFYAVDPHLFSPAEVVFQNIETGRAFAFGGVAHGRPVAVVLRGIDSRSADSSMNSDAGAQSSTR